MTSWPNIGKGLRKGQRIARRPSARRIEWGTGKTSRPVRCKTPHPMYPRQVRCEELRGHAGSHFHSFYMRSWEA